MCLFEQSGLLAGRGPRARGGARSAAGRASELGDGQHDGLPPRRARARGGLRACGGFLLITAY